MESPVVSHASKESWHPKLTSWRAARLTQRRHYRHSSSHESSKIDVGFVSSPHLKLGLD